MANYPNECKICGRPKINTKGCAKHQTAPPMHCITARAEHLAGVVARKEAEGFRKYGEPCKIIGGFSVQVMIQKEKPMEK